MEVFRQAWASLLTWAPSSLRVALALVIAMLVVTKLAPKVVRGCGTILCAGWTPLMMLLTYPEFLLTSLFRRFEWRLMPGTHAYGTALGALATGGTKLGQWLRSRFKTPPHFPWKTAVLAVAVLASCWYLAPKIPPGGARTVMGYVNDDVVIVDSWLATGQWTPVVNSALVCPPTGPTAKAPTKPKPTTKPRRTVKPKPTQ